LQLGPAPQRIAVTMDQVRRLVSEQFPQWSNLPVLAVAKGGWDNWTFHLGSDMSVRLPSAAEYALAIEKEHRWLPKLAPQLPLPISTPLGKGRPGAATPSPGPSTSGSTAIRRAWTALPTRSGSYSTWPTS